MNSGEFSNLLDLICILVVSVASAAPPLLGQPARVIYVDDDAAGANNGSSWADAFNHLQDALAQAAVAAKPVEIRVAQGVYKPDQGAGITPGDQTAGFQLLNGVTLKGGYAGVGASDPDARDAKRCETILNGDLNGDDVEVDDPNCLFWPRSEPTRADNSFHVVTGGATDETAVLDGFVITAGHSSPSTAQPSFDALSGGGMFNHSGSPMVVCCLFRDNFSANGGGGVYNQGGNPVFSGCVFQRNFSGFYAGAINNDNSNPVVTDCTFAENVARHGGGAMGNSWRSTVSLKDCVFKDNKADMGGAVYNDTESTASLEDCTFERNRATQSGTGGAISSWAGLTLTHCTFHQNSAVHSGGAIHTRGGTLLVSDCSFSGNTVAPRSSSVNGGGAIYSGWDTITTIKDSTFAGNAGPNGGAIYSSLGYAKIIGCRFTDNMALMPILGNFSRAGGGAVQAANSIMKLTDCDFQGNRSFDAGGAIRSERATSLILAHCLLAGNRAERGGGICMDDTISGDLRLSNCTLASNFAGDGFALTGSGVLEHCIVWDGSGLMPSSYRKVTAIYYDIQSGFSGEGNIDVDPLFVRPGCWADASDPNLAVGPDHPDAIWVPGDYHLQSQAGHWDRQTQAWVRDDQTSPCIDAGNPAQPFDAEPFPNGGIVNLGAYGGTAEASKSYFGEPVCEILIPGDINGDCKVDLVDTALASQDWRQFPVPPSSQPPTIIITAPTDGAVIEVSPSNPSILIVADASDADGSVKEAKFSIEQRTENSTRRSSCWDNNGWDGWQWQWDFLDAKDPYVAGPYTITARAIDDDCEIAFAPEVHITVIISK